MRYISYYIERDGFRERVSRARAREECQSLSRGGALFDVASGKVEHRLHNPHSTSFSDESVVTLPSGRCLIMLEDSHDYHI